MDAVALQLIIPGLVTIVGAVCGVLTLWIKSRGHETRIKMLERETQECLEDRRLKEVMLLEKWPSDAKPLIDAMAVVKAGDKKTGDDTTFRDAIDVMRTLKGGVAP